MDTAVNSSSEKHRLHPFNVLDQTAAHRLAMEGYKIINVIPSNKYAKEAHFLFCFDATSAFKKRFKQVIAEVEAEAAAEEAKKAAANEAILAEKTAALNAEIEKLRAENDEILRKISEKTAENAEKTPKNDEKMPKNDEKSHENDDFTPNFAEKCDKLLDEVAELKALGNCILSNVSAIGFFKGIMKNKEE